MAEPTLPAILDVEASGFGADGYPIEVGVALRAGERHSLLVRPEPGWTHWDEAAERVHRIPRAVLEAHGRAVTEVAARLNSLLAGKTLYSDAWVLDKPWLVMLFHAAGTQMRFGLSPIEAILSEARMALWDEVKRAVVAELAVERHRASHDAWVVQETFLRVRELAAAREGETRGAGA